MQKFPRPIYLFYGFQLRFYCMTYFKHIYFKFHENRSRGLRAVGGRKSPSPIDLAHGLYNSLYYRTSRDISVSMTVTYAVTYYFTHRLFNENSQYVSTSFTHHFNEKCDSVDMIYWQFGETIFFGPTCISLRCALYSCKTRSARND